MNKIIKRQRTVISILLIAVAATNFCYGIALEHQKKQVADLEKINFELQMNSDKLQEVNDTYYSRIVTQQEKIENLSQSLDRVLTINKEDVKKIQAVVMSETRGSTLSDAMAVTQTILDRSVLWNKSGKEIVEAPGQYAAPYNGAASEMVQLAFNLVYLDGYRAFDEPITHFYNRALCNPDWATNKNFAGSIGDHQYYF